MSRLILGTAEFSPDGYAGKPAVDVLEVRNIFGLAREAGITMLDTAESYGCHELIKNFARGYSIYTKTRDWKVQLAWGDNELRGILYHYGHDEKPVNLPFIHRWVNLGASVYKNEQLPEEVTRIIQVPLSIKNHHFNWVFETYRTVFVRSVFDRGELLKDFTIKQCLNHAKRFRPDGIIVGVNSAKELDDILVAWDQLK